MNSFSDRIVNQSVDPSAAQLQVVGTARKLGSTITPFVYVVLVVIVLQIRMWRTWLPPSHANTGEVRCAGLLISGGAEHDTNILLSASSPDMWLSSELSILLATGGRRAKEPSRGWPSRDGYRNTLVR